MSLSFSVSIGNENVARSVKLNISEVVAAFTLVIVSQKRPIIQLDQLVRRVQLELGSGSVSVSFVTVRNDHYGHNVHIVCVKGGIENRPAIGIVCCP